MQKFPAALFILSPQLLANAVAEPLSWADCKSTVECTVALDPCGWPAGVQKHRLRDYEAFVAETAPLIECAHSLQVCVGSEAIASEFLARLKAECINGHCQIIAALPASARPDCPKKLPLQ